MPQCSIGVLNQSRNCTVESTGHRACPSGRRSFRGGIRRARASDEAEPAISSRSRVAARYDRSALSFAATSRLPSTKISQLSAAYGPQPGSARTSSRDCGRPCDQHAARFTNFPDRCRPKPKQRTTCSTSDTSAAANSAAVGHLALMPSSTGCACVHLVTFARTHATNIQNGSERRSSLNSLSSRTSLMSLSSRFPIG